MNGGKVDGVKLSDRIVPVPNSISADAQAALRRLVDADGTPINAGHVMPARDDFDGWMRVKAMVDTFYDQAAERMEAQARSHAETITIGDATVHVATPQHPVSDACAYIDLHGGALVSGGGAACRASARMQADQHGIRCYGIDYRMPPEHPYPAALDDCLAVYRHVLELHGPENIVIGGRSAGGNLAAAMVLRARDEGLPLPAGLVLLSPEVDLTESGDSFGVNQLVDVVLTGSLMPQNLLYAAGADLSHPYLSPLFGDFSKGFPPTFLQSGTRDLFLSNAVRMHRRLRQADIATELHVFEAMPHGGFMGAPEDRELAQEVARFVNERVRGQR
jgi:acetyl esterase/lipase